MGHLNSIFSSSSQVHANEPPVSGGGLSQDGRFSYGYASSPGKRLSMKNFLEARNDNVSGEIVGLFSIFDGHGGARAAEYVKKNLFNDSFSQTDSELLKFENNQQRDAGSIGSTAILVGGQLLFANVGDFRSVVSWGGNAIAVSRKQEDAWSVIKAAVHMIFEGWHGTQKETLGG